MKERIIPNHIRDEVIKRCGLKCFYCGKEGFLSNRFGKPTVLEKEPFKKWVNEFDGTFILAHKAMHFDHIIPLSKGGKLTVENIVIACSKCNLSKKDSVCGRWKNVKKTNFL